jgi:hypothetical protein
MEKEFQKYFLHCEIKQKIDKKIDSEIISILINTIKE